MEQRELVCPYCTTRFKRSQEKHTDVNIATSMLVDCFDDAMDAMVVLSADADMLPAIRVAKERFGKRVILIDLPRRRSDALAAISDVHLHVSRQALAQSQLPNPVVWTRKGKHREVWMPPTWI